MRPVCCLANDFIEINQIKISLFWGPLGSWRLLLLPVCILFDILIVDP